jgi:hypothetical protein
MKTRSTGRKLFAMAMALAMLAAIWAAWGTNQVDAAQADYLTTGMFGVARGQTARINAVCLPAKQKGADVGPCRVEMMFLDSMGNVISRSESRELRGGQASFFDIDATAFIIEGGRVELRAVVKAFGEGIRQLNFTAEVFDNDTFKTTFFVPSDSFEDCACGGPIPENQ